MGEAKHRAERRREARAAGRSEPRYNPSPRFQDYSPFLISQALSEELQIEYAHSKKAHPETTGGIRNYMHALLEAAVEIERRGREERETQDRLVQAAIVLPPGIAEQAKRLQEIKKGI